MIRTETLVVCDRCGREARQRPPDPPGIIDGWVDATFAVYRYSAVDNWNTVTFHLLLCETCAVEAVTVLDRIDDPARFRPEDYAEGAVVRAPFDPNLPAPEATT